MDLRYKMTYIFYILHIHHPTFKHCQLRIYASIIVFKLSSTYQSNSCTSVFLENKKNHNHNFCEIKYKKGWHFLFCSNRRVLGRTIFLQTFNFFLTRNNSRFDEFREMKERCTKVQTPSHD